MKRIFGVALMLLICSASFAQSTIRVQAPNVVAVDEQFNLTFIIEGENSPSDFSWTPGSEFQLVWGPQKGTSTSIRIDNGKRTKTSQSTFTYVLMPRQTGTFQIPEASATVKGNTIRSEKASIEVVSGGSSSGNQSGSSSSSQSQESRSSTGEISQDDLFLRLSVSRNSVVVGEPVNVTLKLFQRVNIAGFEDAKFPQFTGFWSQEVFAPTNIEFQRESYNDKIYNTAVLRSWVIIPQQAGEMEIEPAELVCLVNIRTGSVSNSIFDSFFQDDYRTIRKRVYSQGSKIRVNSLPAGAPASFGGGVGTFKISASLDKDSLKTHEAASLKVTVSGSGNVSLLEAPKINFPPDFEVYDTKTSESTDKSGGRTSGSKTFEYPFIPRSHGDFTLGPVEYSYYDVNTHKYVTLKTDEIQIEVLKGTETAQSAGAPVVSVNRKDVKDLDSDIRFIFTKKPQFHSGSTFFCGSVAFWILTLALLSLAVIVWFSLRKYAAMRADTAGTRNRKASKMAQKRLAQAGEFLSKNLHTAFYEELHRALLGYISDKLNMDFADMTKENIASVLQERGISEGLAAEFNNLLDACEFARYSPSAGHEAMDEHFKSALETISSIDTSMKSKKNTIVPVLILLLALSPLSLKAEQVDYPDSLWNAGVAAYQAEQWYEAADAWESVASLGLSSPELFYNIGNAYFRQENYSRAILNYERAQRLDPSNKDIQHNLSFANEFIQDKIESVPEVFFEAWGRKICWALPSNTWSVLFFIFLAVALALAVTFLMGAGRLKKISFYSSIVMLLIALLCVDFAQWQRSDSIKNTSAIIMRAVSSVKSSPSSSSSKDLFILHEGTKVKVIDTVGEWSNIELSDGRQGWMQSSDMEII